MPILTTTATTLAYEIAAGITAIAVAAKAADIVSTPSWYEHVDLLSILVGTLFLIVGWFFVRTLNRLSQLNDDISKTLIAHGERISCLEGKHENGSHTLSYSHTRSGDAQ